MAKRFFLICGGVLMLAIAWRVAVPPAHAQSTVTVDAAYMDARDGGVSLNIAASGRTLYFNDAPIGLPIPGTSKVIEIVQSVNSPDFFVMLANGDMYHLPFDHSSWSYWGNAIGAAGPTAAHPTSFGQLKVKYR